MKLNKPIISIEDDEDDQKFIAMALKELRVPNPLYFFSDGLAALPYLEAMTEQPFLILCDINMPLMNGMELRDHINRRVTLKKKCIPFVYLTVLSGVDIVQRAYEQNTQGFYQKANSYAGLLGQIRLLITLSDELSSSR